MRNVRDDCRAARWPSVSLRDHPGVGRARAPGRLLPWLAGHGVELLYPPSEFGAQAQITAVHDPDGNLVELTQLGPSWLDHLRAHRADGGDLIADWSARA